MSHTHPGNTAGASATLSASSAQFLNLRKSAHQRLPTFKFAKGCIHLREPLEASESQLVGMHVRGCDALTHQN